MGKHRDPNDTNQNHKAHQKKREKLVKKEKIKKNKKKAKKERSDIKRQRKEEFSLQQQELISERFSSKVNAQDLETIKLIIRKLYENNPKETQEEVPELFDQLD